MNKIILEAKNVQELEVLIKKTITLQEDETYLIKEIKKPFNLFFIKLNGKYEITILKKTELKKIEKEQLNCEFKKLNKNNKKQVEEKVKTEKKEIKEEKITKEKEIDEIIKEKFLEFTKIADLKIEIKNIETKNTFKILNLEGKDVRYIIGEKGIALTSLENVLNSFKEFRNYKIILDSNDYKSKREESLRQLADKKAEKVLSTKTSYKLNPMSARERRIIHEQISKYDNLKTESFGEEPKRYLVIKYLKKED